MSAPRSAPHPARSLRPARRLRLLAVAAAPLALAGTALAPAAASSHATAPAAPAATHRAATTAGLRPLPPPGQDAPVTVTLITGDQVAVTKAAGGRYTATAVPGPGSSPRLGIAEQTGPGGVTTSLQAIPEAARQLVSTGQVNQGLFDVKYLATHGDTGPQARIPVTIAYAGHPAAAQLAAGAARLPGATVLAAAPATGQVKLSVAASRAAAFWAALTGPAPATTGPTGAPARAGLAGGAARIWLTGHQAAPAASPRPQDGQPLYTVTETIIRTTGPVDNDCLNVARAPAGFQVTLAPDLCWIDNDLLGVAGPGAGQLYQQPGWPFADPSCVSKQPANPAPVCTAWQLSYQVPAGVYSLQGIGEILTTGNADQTLEPANVELDVPQFTVTGNTSITINADQAVPVTFTTPQPGQWASGTMESTRRLADGSGYETLWDSLQGDTNWQAVPTRAGERATIGFYDFGVYQALQRPQATATVTGPAHLALHPVYPLCIDSDCEGDSITPSRFSGRQSLQLVDAGTGTAADFSKIDARGKLALIRTAYQNAVDPGVTFVNWDDQLENAMQAGAAGVLFDASTDQFGYSYQLPNHVYTRVSVPGQRLQTQPIPGIPVAEIDNAEADSVLSQLAKGPVTVSIDDSGQTPYAYFLRYDSEGQIPGSLHYTVTSRQLAEVDSSYHAAAPSAPFEIRAWPARADFDIFSRTLLEFTGPGRIREYYGPLSPGTLWVLDTTQGTFAENQSLPEPFDGQAWTLFSQPARSTLDWGEPPAAPGALPPSTGVYQAQPGYVYDLHQCAGCREGNVFYPVVYPVTGGSPGADTTGRFGDGYAPGSIHLYNQAGQEIQPTSFNGIATYQLPAQQARYKLVTPTTTWNFTSAEPVTDQTPAGTVCVGTDFGVSTAPCHADPLVFLRYDAGLSLANTIIPGTHQLQVTGYHQDPSAPPVTSLKLWTSTDGGTTWQQAYVTSGRDGVFTAIYTVPVSGTNGYVSIKAQASDAAGNDIIQELDNAYGIAAGTSGQATRPGK